MSATKAFVASHPTVLRSLSLRAYGKTQVISIHQPIRSFWRNVLLGVLVPLLALLSAGRGFAQQAATQKELLETFVQEFVNLTPGTDPFPPTFVMGSPSGDKAEQPPQRVTLRQPFAIAKYEVPQNLYQMVMGENPSRWKGPRNSVEMMTAEEAIQFCQQVTRLLHQKKLIEPDDLIRLPSEAEWEYACRAGTTTSYSFGENAHAENEPRTKTGLLNQYAWHTGNAAGNDPPVGALKPNPWGLYDVHGYLWEITADGWTETHAGHPGTEVARPLNPSDPNQSPQKIVMRGGSWKDSAELLRSASRQKFGLTQRDDAVGFRCVKAKAVKTKAKPNSTDVDSKSP